MKKTLLCAFLFWGVLFLLGYPYPHGDDLWYLVPSLNFADTGVVNNPLAAGWNAVKHAETGFYATTPFAFYIVGAWLKIFGTSIQTVTFFYFLCYFLFSILTAYLMRTYRFSALSAALVILSFAVWQCLGLAGPWHGNGLRHEPLAFIFAVLGACFLLKSSFLRLFLGFFFLCASVGVLPIMISYAPFLGAAVLLTRHDLNLKVLGKYMVCAAAASALTVFLFGAAIHFDWQLFMKDFLLHAHYRRPPDNETFHYLTGYLTVGGETWIRLPKFAAFAVLFVLSLAAAAKFKNFKAASAVLCLAGALAANLLFYVGAVSFAKWAVEAGILVLLDKILVSRGFKKTLIASAAIIFLPGILWTSAGILFADHSKPETEMLREYVRLHPEKKYIIDSTAARWVFGYDFPKGVRFESFTDPIRERKSVRERKEDEVWIVSKADLAAFMPDAGVKVPCAEIFGRRFSSLPRKPFELMMISREGAAA